MHNNNKKSICALTKRSLCDMREEDQEPEEEDETTKTTTTTIIAIDRDDCKFRGGFRVLLGEKSLSHKF